MLHRILVLPHQQNIEVPDGTNLLQALRDAGLAPDAPCGGNGRCGKCAVLLDGTEVRSCRTTVCRDMTITIPTHQTQPALTNGINAPAALQPIREGYLLAFDIGTTTVAGYLLEGQTGRELACESAQNPQAAFGADVISRIRHALDGQMEALTKSIRSCVAQLAAALCQKAGIDCGEVGVISLVGNPAMQQLFLGIRPENLAQLPFAPVLTRAEAVNAANYLPACENALLLIVPDISGFVGSDTVAGVLASGIDTGEEITLLVDIGTNGEMVLGNRHRMVACSTAAGPALEGANITFGMRGHVGSIDHVWLEGGKMRCSVIGDTEAAGICGSGLVDAVATALELGLINQRGRILTESRRIWLTDTIYLTQEDIRQVQLAKGAIAAGIHLLAQQLGIGLEQIEKVYLAGAFGTFLDPRHACRIEMLPPVLADRITAIGNAAGSGAKALACSRKVLARSEALTRQIQAIELATLPQFAKTFATCMRF